MISIYRDIRRVRLLICLKEREIGRVNNMIQKLEVSTAAEDLEFELAKSEALLQESLREAEEASKHKLALLAEIEKLETQLQNYLYIYV